MAPWILTLTRLIKERVRMKRAVTSQFVRGWTGYAGLRALKTQGHCEETFHHGKLPDKDC